MCSLKKLLDRETLSIPFYRCVHKVRAIFGPTPCHKASAINFDMFQLKIVQNSKFVERLTRVSSVVEGLPWNELDRLCSTARVSLHHNRPIFRVVYNHIKEAHQATKEIREGLRCRRKIIRGLRPPVHLFGCFLTSDSTYIQVKQTSLLCGLEFERVLNDICIDHVDLIKIMNV